MTVDFSDLAKRAVHTFLQAFLGALAIAYAASGLDVSQIVDADSAKKFGLALATAVLAAALSAAKTTVAQTIPGARIPDDLDTGTGSLEPDRPRPEHKPEHAAE